MRRRHLVDSTTCDAVEAILRLQFLLADRDEAVGLRLICRVVKLQTHRSAPTGFTKSNMMATELSFAGTVPLCGSTAAYDWTARLPAIATAAQRIKAKRFTIDGEAIVLGPDGLSRFEELRNRETAHAAILYAFDLSEHDSEGMRNHPFLNRKAALAGLLRDTEAGILLNPT